MFSYDVGFATADDADADAPSANGVDTIKDFTTGEDKNQILQSALADPVVDALDPVEDGADPVDVAEPEAALPVGLTFDDLFLGLDDSVAVIEAGYTTIRLNGVDIEDLSEDDLLFI